MTIKLHLAFMLIITSLVLASCASYKGFPDRVISSDTELENLQVYFLPTTDKDYVKDYNDAGSDEAKRQRIRNEVINGRITAIDIQFSLFQQTARRRSQFKCRHGCHDYRIGSCRRACYGWASQILSATSAA